MFRYECWDCGKWHNTNAAGAWDAFANGFARIGIASGEKTLPLQPNGSQWVIQDIRRKLERNG